MSRAGRAVVAILVAAAVLWLAGWLDGTVIPYLWRQAAQSFDITWLSIADCLGVVTVAGGVLLVAVLGWRSHSALVGVGYVLVGAFFVFMPVIEQGFAWGLNSGPSLQPSPMPDALGQIYLWSYGPFHAVATIGAGMFVVGLLVVGRSIRARPISRRATEAVSGVGATGAGDAGVSSVLGDAHSSTGNSLGRG